MKYAILLVIITLVVTSCNLGSETVSISSNSFFGNNGKGNRMITSKNNLLYKTTVYPDIISHAYNDDFIVAKQKPERTNWNDYLGFDLYNRYTSYAAYLQDSKIFEKNAWRNLKGKIEGDSANYQYFHSRGASDENSSSDMYISRKIADSLIDNDPYYQKIFAHEFNYWIIWNAKDSLIGPLTKDEYLVKRKALHIPDDLELEE